MRWPSTLQLTLSLAALGLAAAFLQRHVAPTMRTGQAVAIDGDSLRVDGAEIRLKGVDAPEYRQSCQKDRAEVPCGLMARRALAALLARGPVSCRLSGRDRYGRDLGYCRAGDVDLNAAMVRDGQAVAFGDYQAEEQEARQARRGLWALTFETPSVWREKHPRPGAIP